MSATQHRVRAHVALGAGLAALSSTVAVAQPPGETIEGAGEIVITAQKRPELAGEVPLSISVIDGETLQAARLSQADDIAALVPNLRFSATVGENTPIFALRGVSMSDFSLNQAGPVATYYDEVYKGNFAFLGVQLYDLARIEVLRGPQGTLYGKNTTGGAINYLAERPRFENGGYLKAGIGNFGRAEGQGALNLAISSTLAARIAFTAARADGWFRNRLAGSPNLSATREYGVRGSILWKPSDSAELVLRLSTSLQTPQNYGTYSVPGPGGTGAGVYEAYGRGMSYFRTGIGKREIEANFTPRRRARTWSAALTGTFRLSDNLSLVSVTGWDRGSLFVPEDTDGSPTRTLEIPYTDRGTQFGQELRLAYDGDGALSLILGLHHHREDLFNATDLNFWTDLDVDGNGRVDVDDCSANASLMACAISNRFDQRKRSWALFGDAHMKLGTRTGLRGGLRFTRDIGLQAGLTSQLRGVDGVLVATPILPLDRSFAGSNLSGKIGIDHKLADGTMFFASYSRGYRASGFNAQAFFDAAEAGVARPETIDALEAGAKTRLAGNALAVAVTGFHYIYRNQQFLSVDPADATQTLVNLDRSRIYGAEIELEARPTSEIAAQIGVGILHARATQGMIGGLDVSGHSLSNAPSLTLNAAVAATIWERGPARMALRGDASYTSSQFFEIVNIPRLRQPGYALLGASVDYARGPMILSIWGKNLGDKVYFTSSIDLSGFGFDYNHVGTPRTYGATARVSF
ncbi:TonB-dependent receptor (plasmid) [Novosphingobium aromaticivorans DSM 12444]|uniref:TonB-dependent receptor n=1 Tax=Novosphingobium aromaticivorans (strain ATCC 700278 / DSM 12444 / CCUG 56034 / CIP 105152 / NBRC 16084 / F199) TaxID=279238 RepID=A4XFD3_NOVAD|nr:TonB-dependent receptor [Novosphingobium aromaticivorans]ABP64644.1 TonB-dependent receptor [Novosphingobium aromaticivorans DSM 12444]SCY91912.1 iron complex outermembrane recepter protein [Novosphingobium aromaticivorans]